MTQVMRRDEAARVAREAKQFAASHPGDTAVLVLVADLLSQAHEDGPAVVMAALGAATQAARDRRPPGMPDAERRLWERAGASFEVAAIVHVDAARAASFADLVARSVLGDAAVAELLGVDRSRVSQRIGERSLYAFGASGEDRGFPRWQFNEAKTIRGLKVVLAALDADVHPLVVDHWFCTPSIDLDVGGEPVSPVSWLATGGSPTTAAALAADL